MTPESETTQTKKPEVIDCFREVLDKVAQTPGERIDIVNSYHDTWGNFMRTTSMFTGCVIGEDKVKEALKQLILENVPDGESQATLEQGFKEEAKCVKRGSHGDTYQFEWELVRDNVVIGLETIQDQRSESVRTWYLRNTLQKPSIFSFLKRQTA